MAFHFSLEGLLRIRCLLEEQERVRLQSMLARKATLLSRAARSQDLTEALQNQVRQLLSQRPLSATDIHFSETQMQNLMVERQLLEADLLCLTRTIAQQSQRLAHRRKEREVLDHLRETQLASYHLSEKRREQAQLDELYLLRRIGTTRP